MSLVKILNFGTNAVKRYASEEFAKDLNRKIEERLFDLPGVERLPYEKPDVIRLIGAIETYKRKCLKGEINANRLYRDVDYELSLFKIKHPGFDYMTDPVLDFYFS
jgi:hypothetical protein